MNLRSYNVGSVAVLRPNGRFDSASAPPVVAWLNKMVATAPARIVIDMADVTFIDSTALAALVRGLQRSRSRGGDLYICAVTRPVLLVFELTRLDRSFPIFASELEAIQAFATGERESVGALNARS